MAWSLSLSSSVQAVPEMLTPRIVRKQSAYTLVGHLLTTSDSIPMLRWRTSHWILFAFWISSLLMVDILWHASCVFLWASRRFLSSLAKDIFIYYCAIILFVESFTSIYQHSSRWHGDAEDAAPRIRHRRTTAKVAATPGFNDGYKCGSAGTASKRPGHTSLPITTHARPAFTDSIHVAALKCFRRSRDVGHSEFWQIFIIKGCRC